MNRKPVLIEGNVLCQEVYRKTSARDLLEQVTPSCLWQVRDGFTDSGVGLCFIISHHHKKGETIQ